MSYNIVAELQVRGPFGLGQALTSLQNQLRNFKGEVPLTATAAAVRQNMGQNDPASTGRANAAGLRAIAQNQQISAQMQTLTKQAKTFGEQTETAFKRFGAYAVATTPLLGMVAALRTGVLQALEFERSLIKVAQISGETNDRVNKLQEQVGTLATKFGVSSAELAESALIFKQTGLSIGDTTVALEALAKASLAPNFDSMKQTSEGAIAVMRQFRVGAGDLEGALGSMNAVAGDFAVEARDLIELVQKAGGAFSAVAGHTTEPRDALNQLMAVFTSVRATTRESASEISTGMRTIFTRLQRGQTEDALRGVGVQLRYTAQEARELGKIELTGQFVGAYESVRRLSEAMSKIPTTDPRYAKVVEEIGGYRQISRVLPMLGQFTEAQKALQVARAGEVSLSIAADRAQDGQIVKFIKLREEYQKMTRELVGSRNFKELTSGLVGLGQSFLGVFKYLSPLIPALTALAAVKIAPLVGRMGVNLVAGAVGFGGKSAEPSFQVPRPRGYSSGGHVGGSGVGDTVPAMLEPGEFVIRKQAANVIGHHGLNHLNQGGSLSAMRFAGGGVVNRKQTGKRSLQTTLPENQIYGIEDSLGRPEDFISDEVFLRQVKRFQRDGSISVGQEVVPWQRTMNSPLGRMTQRKIVLPFAIMPRTKHSPVHDEHFYNEATAISLNQPGIVVPYMDSLRPTGKRFGDEGIRFENQIRQVLQNLGVKDDSPNALNRNVSFVVGGLLRRSAQTEKQYGNFHGNLKDSVTQFLDSHGISNENEYHPYHPYSLANIHGRSLYTDEQRNELLSGAIPEGDKFLAVESMFQNANQPINHFLKNNPEEQSLLFGEDGLPLINMKDREGKSIHIGEWMRRYGAMRNRKPGETGKHDLTASDLPAKRFAGGGHAEGFGATDSVPAMLTPGEFVLRREAAQHIGPAMLNKFNHAEKHRGDLGFANGGLVPGFTDGGEAKPMTLMEKMKKRQEELRAKENIVETSGAQAYRAGADVLASADSPVKREPEVVKVVPEKKTIASLYHPEFDAAAGPTGRTVSDMSLSDILAKASFTPRIQPAGISEEHEDIFKLANEGQLKAAQQYARILQQLAQSTAPLLSSTRLLSDANKLAAMRIQQVAVAASPDEVRAILHTEDGKAVSDSFNQLFQSATLQRQGRNAKLAERYTPGVPEARLNTGHTLEGLYANLSNSIPITTNEADPVAAPKKLTSSVTRLNQLLADPKAKAFQNLLQDAQKAPLAENPSKFADLHVEAIMRLLGHHSFASADLTDDKAVERLRRRIPITAKAMAKRPEQLTIQKQAVKRIQNQDGLEYRDRNLATLPEHFSKHASELVPGDEGYVIQPGDEDYDTSGNFAPLDKTVRHDQKKLMSPGRARTLLEGQQNAAKFKPEGVNLTKPTDISGTLNQEWINREISRRTAMSHQERQNNPLVLRASGFDLLEQMSMADTGAVDFSKVNSLGIFEHLTQERLEQAQKAVAENTVVPEVPRTSAATKKGVARPQVNSSDIAARIAALGGQDRLNELIALPSLFNAEKLKGAADKTGRSVVKTPAAVQKLVAERKKLGGVPPPFYFLQEAIDKTGLSQEELSAQAVRGYTLADVAEAKELASLQKKAGQEAKPKRAAPAPKTPPPDPAAKPKPPAKSSPVVEMGIAAALAPVTSTASPLAIGWNPPREFPSLVLPPSEAASQWVSRQNISEELAAQTGQSPPLAIADRSPSLHSNPFRMPRQFDANVNQPWNTPTGQSLLPPQGIIVPPQYPRRQVQSDEIHRGYRSPLGFSESTLITPSWQVNHRNGTAMGEAGMEHEIPELGIFRRIINGNFKKNPKNPYYLTTFRNRTPESRAEERKRIDLEAHANIPPKPKTHTGASLSGGLAGQGNPLDQFNPLSANYHKPSLSSVPEMGQTFNAPIHEQISYQPEQNPSLRQQYRDSNYRLMVLTGEKDKMERGGNSQPTIDPAGNIVIYPDLPRDHPAREKEYLYRIEQEKARKAYEAKLVEVEAAKKIRDENEKLYRDEQQSQNVKSENRSNTYTQPIPTQADTFSIKQEFDAASFSSTLPQAISSQGSPGVFVDNRPINKDVLHSDPLSSLNLNHSGPFSGSSLVHPPVFSEQFTPGDTAPEQLPQKKRAKTPGEIIAELQARMATGNSSGIPPKPPAPPVASGGMDDEDLPPLPSLSLKLTSSPRIPNQDEVFSGTVSQMGEAVRRQRQLNEIPTIAEMGDKIRSKRQSGRYEITAEDMLRPNNNPVAPPLPPPPPTPEQIRQQEYDRSFVGPNPRQNRQQSLTIPSPNLPASYDGPTTLSELTNLIDVQNTAFNGQKRSGAIPPKPPTSQPLVYAPSPEHQDNWGLSTFKVELERRMREAATKTLGGKIRFDGLPAETQNQAISSHYKTEYSRLFTELQSVEKKIGLDTYGLTDKEASSFSRERALKAEDDGHIVVSRTGDGLLGTQQSFADHKKRHGANPEQFFTPRPQTISYENSQLGVSSLSNEEYFSGRVRAKTAGEIKNRGGEALLSQQTISEIRSKTETREQRNIQRELQNAEERLLAKTNPLMSLAERRREATARVVAALEKEQLVLNERMRREQAAQSTGQPVDYTGVALPKTFARNTRGDLLGLSETFAQVQRQLTESIRSATKNFADKYRQGLEATLAQSGINPANATKAQRDTAAAAFKATPEFKSGQAALAAEIARLKQDAVSGTNISRRDRLRTSLSDGYESFQNAMGAVGRRTEKIDNSLFGRGLQRGMMPLTMTAIPMLSQSMTESAGKADVAGMSDEGSSRYIQNKGMAGAMEWASAGAIVGTAVAGPLGATVGAVGGAIVGGTVGYLNAIKDAANEIRQVRMDIALNKFTEHLKNFIASTNTIFDLRLSGNQGKADRMAGLSFGSEAQMLKAMQEHQKEMTEKNVSESTHYFGSVFRPGEFQASQTKDFRQNYGSQLTEITNALSGQAEVLGKKNYGVQLGDGGNLGRMETLLKGPAGELNDVLLSMVARLRQIPVKQVIGEMMETFREGQKQEQYRRAKLSKDTADERNINTFSRLASVLQSATDEMERFATATAYLSEALTGQFGSTKVSLGLGKLDQFGRFDGAGMDPIRSVAGVAGKQGGSLLEAGEAATQIRKYLDSALITVGKQDIDNPEEMTGRIRKALETSMGINDRNENSPENSQKQSAIESVIGGMHDLMKERGPIAFYEGLKKDPTKLSETLASGYTDTVRDNTKKSGELIERAGQMFVDKLTEIRRAMSRFGEMKFEAGRAQLEAGRTRAEFAAESTFSGRRATDKIPLAQLNAPIQQRMEQLTGNVGAAANDPVQIGKQLRGTLRDIKVAEGIQREAIKQEGGSGSAAFQEAAKAVDSLKAKAEQYQQALVKLTDASERSAAAQDRLAKIKGDEDSRLSFVEKYATASFEDKARMNRGMGLVMTTGKANVNQMGPDQLRLLFETLRSAGDATVKTKDGVFTGNEMAKQLAAALGGTPNGWKTPQMAKDKTEAMLDIAKNMDVRAKALEEIAKNQRSIAEDMRSSLTEANDSFLTKLHLLFIEQQAMTVKQQQGQATAERKDLDKLDKHREILTKAGVTDKNLPDVIKSGDTISAYLKAKRTEREEQEKIKVGEKAAADQEFSPNTIRQTNSSVPNKFNIQPDIKQTVLDSQDTFKKLGESGISDIMQSKIMSLFTSKVQNIKQMQADQDNPGEIKATKILIQQRIRQALKDSITEVLAYNPESPMREANKRTTSEGNKLRAIGLDPKKIDAENGAKFLEALAAFKDGRTFEQLTNQINAVDLKLKQFGETLDGLNKQRDNENNILPASETRQIRDRATQRLIEGTVTENPLGFLHGVALPGANLLEEYSAGTAPANISDDARTRRPIQRANGGGVDWAARGTDTVPAMLTPGEFVINKASYEANRDAVHQINSGKGVKYFDEGGPVVQGVGRYNPNLSVKSQVYIQEMAKWGKLIQSDNLDDVDDFYKELRTSYGNTDMARAALKIKPDGVAAGRIQAYLDIHEQYRKMSFNKITLEQWEIDRKQPQAENKPVEQIRHPARSARPTGQPLFPSVEGYTVRKENLENNQIKLRDYFYDRLLAQQWRIGFGKKKDSFQLQKEAEEMAQRHMARKMNRYVSNAQTGYAAQRADLAYGTSRAGDDGQKQIADRAIQIKLGGFLAGVRADNSFSRFGRADAAPQFFVDNEEGKRRRKFATGGLVGGSGSTDSVASLLMPGEFVMTKDSVKQIGANALARMNESPQRFATGGLVGGSTTSIAGVPASAGMSPEVVQAFARLTSVMGSFGQSFTRDVISLADGLAKFNESANSLADALRNFPSTLTVSANQRVELIVNGAEVLTRIMPELRSMVVDTAKSQLMELLKKYLPDAGIPPQ